jgi:hypothetical protein
VSLERILAIRLLLSIGVSVSTIWIISIFLGLHHPFFVYSGSLFIASSSFDLSAIDKASLVGISEITLGQTFVSTRLLFAGIKLQSLNIEIAFAFLRQLDFLLLFSYKNY